MTERPPESPEKYFSRAVYKVTRKPGSLETKCEEIRMAQEFLTIFFKTIFILLTRKTSKLKMIFSVL